MKVLSVSFCLEDVRRKFVFSFCDVSVECATLALIQSQTQVIKANGAAIYYEFSENSLHNHVSFFPESTMVGQ